MSIVIASPVPRPAGAAAADARERSGALSSLLLLVAALVLAMVVVGGITRLTESGLSITEWKPISGVIPPLTQADWTHAFDLYQQTPQYREVAGPAGMALSGFKFIFFWEWVHRFLGRILGLVFFVGFRAGYVSNSWPDMNGRIFPEGVDWSHGLLWAMTHDPFLLHFMHRWWAWVVVAVLVLFARQVRKVEGARPASIAIHAAFGT